VFLLEYAQGMWGRASSPDQINALLKLHGLQFDLIQRTPYLAKRQGSALVRQVLETLRQTAEGQSDPIRPVPPEAKLVIYVGHDTNLANIGGTLGVDWEFKSGLQDKTPPAGAMAFELLREAGTSNYFVRMAYYTQTLDQMRDATPLRPSDPTGKTTPDVARIVPGCASGGDGTCSWKDFHTWAKGALDPDCVAVNPR
jgi:4-phytase/acid phosphatase